MTPPERPDDVLRRVELLALKRIWIKGQRVLLCHGIDGDECEDPDAVIAELCQQVRRLVEERDGYRTGGAATLERLAKACAMRDRLMEDQADWRKGVALIASALGERDPSNLSCVRISEKALELGAERDALRARVVELEGYLRSRCTVTCTDLLNTYRTHVPNCPANDLALPEAVAPPDQEPR